MTDFKQENRYIVLKRTDEGDNTTSLTEKQIDVLERIYEKNFAG